MKFKGNGTDDNVKLIRVEGSTVKGFACEGCYYYRKSDRCMKIYVSNFISCLTLDKSYIFIPLSNLFEEL